MSNTQLRIISAIVMVSILLLGISLGQKAALIIVYLVGAVVIDELLVNFIKLKRINTTYIFSQILFAGSYWQFTTDPRFIGIFKWFAIASLLINVLLFAYLFFVKMDSDFVTKLLKRFPILAVFMAIIPLFTLSRIILADEWIKLLWALIFINFSVDTFAWLFGKKLGKHKLWPEVSPKKTMEGAIGGIIGCLVLGGWYLNEMFHNVSYITLIYLFFLAICAQLGDLVQSKLKRQFEIKDSSNLIPGHGGFYDRIDSLLFVCPLYLLLLVTTNLL